MTPEALANNETIKTSRALIILFPDARTVGGPNYLSQRELTPFEQRLRTTAGKLMDYYKQNGYQIFGLVYSDTDQEDFCQYYHHEKFDRLIPMNTSFGSWTQEIYKQEIPKIISSMNLNPASKVYVSGYHSTDCVAQMASELHVMGHNATADLRLSNHLPELLLAHTVRNTLRIIDAENAWRDYQIWQITKQEVESEIRKRRKT